MKIAIVGSRDFPALHLVTELVGLLPEDTIVVSGKARGVDITAENAAKARGLQVDSYPVTKEEWKANPKTAGLIRNRKIEKNAQACIAFHDGKSTGTAHTISLFVGANKPMTVVHPGPRLPDSLYEFLNRIHRRGSP
jgi:hypothetical protein